MNITHRVVNRGIDYIIRNLNRELTVEDIAKHCHFSKYYFNRVFKAETGESIYSFIKRLRMEKSALRLGTDVNRTITDICWDFGYSSSNYSSAFRKHHRISPVEYRKLKKANMLDRKHPLFDTELTYRDYPYYDNRITIRVEKDFPVLFERHIGSYEDMADHWADFIHQYSHLANKQTRFIEITYDDPNLTDINRCIYDICMTVDDREIRENTRIIEGGRFAVYRFEGSSRDILQAYKGIFNVWIPNSSCKLDDRIGFDSYEIADCGKDYFEMGIYIPVK